MLLALISFLSQSNSRMKNFRWVVISSPRRRIMHHVCTSCESVEIGSCGRMNARPMPRQLFHYNRRSGRLMIAICPKVLNAIARLGHRSLWENFNLRGRDLYLHAKVPRYTCPENEINERHVRRMRVLEDLEISLQITEGIFKLCNRLRLAISCPPLTVDSL